jgi:hypothetical protein
MNRGLADKSVRLEARFRPGLLEVTSQRRSDPALNINFSR